MASSPNSLKISTRETSCNVQERKKRAYIRHKPFEPKRSASRPFPELNEVEDRLHDDATIDEKENYRRKRSLKFRAMMCNRRNKLFGEPFLRVDRKSKNAGKARAAKNRERDDTGKFFLKLQAACP